MKCEKQLCDGPNQDFGGGFSRSGIRWPDSLAGPPHSGGCQEGLHPPPVVASLTVVPLRGSMVGLCWGGAVSG